MVKAATLFVFLSKTKTLAISSIFLFVVGVFTVYQSFNGMYFSPGGELAIQGSNVFTVIAIVIFSVFLVFQIFLFMSVRKVFFSLSESNKEISGNISQLKESESDEFKELVFTRNMLLTKLADNNVALKKAKSNVKKGMTKA